ncbi:hypothetical protein AYO40_02350 [Planctomycetaceae bacterium SCGC AG-212-D15]|nr:hypothetical protein AYO40_02350 [Planctomycetaceae bacterium SCGC AG-212-D15]
MSHRRQEAASFRPLFQFAPAVATWRRALEQFHNSFEQLLSGFLDRFYLDLMQLCLMVERMEALHETRYCAVIHRNVFYHGIEYSRIVVGHVNLASSGESRVYPRS